MKITALAIIFLLVLTIFPIDSISTSLQAENFYQTEEENVEPPEDESPVEPVAIEGEIFILGEANFGEVLIADISGILPEEATYTIQWNRNGIPIEEITDIIYTITVEDIAQEISITLTGIGDFSGSITSPIIIPEKADQLLEPQVPRIISIRAENIEIEPIDGHEYRINYGNWQTPIHRDNWDYYTANHSPIK